MQSPADYEDDRHNDDDECLARDACAGNKEPGTSSEGFQFLGTIMNSCHPK